jgi:hypothetical protein
MRRIKLVLPAAVLAVIATTGSALADDPIPPPTTNWAGTTDIEWTSLTDGTPVYPKRVGILAYCADIAHNAGDTGLQGNKKSIKDYGQKQALANLASGLPFDYFPQQPGELQPPLGNWFLDGPFSYLGQYGAQNIVDYLAYDDGIDRLRDVQVIDGDLVLPSGAQLIQNFDILIAYTDNKCGQPIPAPISNSAARALADFVSASTPDAPKKLILTGFAFSRSIGFGNAIFGNGMSPLKKGGPGLAPCARQLSADGSRGPCFIGTCPDGFAPTGIPAECRDANDNFVQPIYQPAPETADFACEHMLPNVNGPTSSSWATALTPAEVDRTATLCFNYDNPPAGLPATYDVSSVPFLAMNAERTIVAVNAFPADRDDIQKFWFGCILGNIVQYLSGDTTRVGF